jgi:hypothetical protein
MLFIRSIALFTVTASSLLSTVVVGGVANDVFDEDSATTTLTTSSLKRHNEFVLLEGHNVRDSYHSPLPYTYIKEDDLPVRSMRQLYL